MPADSRIMTQIRVNPRWLLAAAMGALVVALVSLLIRALVVSAMSWLLFEILAVLSAICIATPVRTGLPEQDTRVPSPNKRRQIARIYRSTPDLIEQPLEKTVVRDEDAG